jgi:hypothetical protein
MTEDGPIPEGTGLDEGTATRRPLDAKPKLGGPEQFALVFASVNGQAVLEAIRQHTHVYGSTLALDLYRSIDPNAVMVNEGARRVTLWIEQQIALGRIGTPPPLHAVSSTVEPSHAKP